MISIPTTQSTEPTLGSTTRYVAGWTSSPAIAANFGVGYCAPPISALSDSFEAFDDDPLTIEEMADLAISCRELAEGKGVILPREMSDEDFLANL